MKRYLVLLSSFLFVIGCEPGSTPNGGEEEKVYTETSFSSSANLKYAYYENDTLFTVTTADSVYFIAGTTKIPFDGILLGGFNDFLRIGNSHYLVNSGGYITRILSPTTGYYASMGTGFTGSWRLFSIDNTNQIILSKLNSGDRFIAKAAFTGDKDFIKFPANDLFKSNSNIQYATSFADKNYILSTFSGKSALYTFSNSSVNGGDTVNFLIDNPAWVNESWLLGNNVVISPPVIIPLLSLPLNYSVSRFNRYSGKSDYFLMETSTAWVITKATISQSGSISTGEQFLSLNKADYTMLSWNREYLIAQQKSTKKINVYDFIRN